MFSIPKSMVSLYMIFHLIVYHDILHAMNFLTSLMLLLLVFLIFFSVISRTVETTQCSSCSQSVLHPVCFLNVVSSFDIIIHLVLCCSTVSITLIFASLSFLKYGKYKLACLSLNMVSINFKPTFF